MNPLSIMNNDMSTFILAYQKVFQSWNDNVSEDFKLHCVEQIQQDWNSYINEMNVRMNIFMRAEKTIDDEIAKYEQYSK